MVSRPGTEADQRSGGTLEIPQVRCGFRRAADIPALLSHAIDINSIKRKGQFIFSVSAPSFLLGVLGSLPLEPFMEADMHGTL